PPPCPPLLPYATLFRSFSEAHALDGVDAVLITHEHPDHLDVDKLVDAAARRPGITIHAHPDVVAKLGELAAVARPVTAGESFERSEEHTSELQSRENLV